MGSISKISIPIYMLAIFYLLIKLAASDDVILNIILKKPIAVVSEKFLSITLDPVAVFNNDLFSSDVEKTTNMAKALAPAYIRIGGPKSNSYIFERGLYSQDTRLDPGYMFSKKHWIQVNQWAKRSGLDVIACLAPQQSESNSNSAKSSFWDPRNALDLISFSDYMGYNTSWQLGYECQTRCDISGVELGRDVQRLRNMLDAFPRYAEHGMIVGPDAITYKTKQQQQYLQDYFSTASGAFAAVTWHPDFASISLETDGVSMHYDTLSSDKDNFYRAVGRQIIKKPLWIAESRPEECKHQFLGALVWARRLGNAAKLGLQVLMRQPDNSNLFKPTPDFWVSTLHKMLVGREVLDTKIAMGNRTHVYFYCQCTNPSSNYEAGSLTVFGINLTPSKITASLKGIKLKIVHKYILLPGFDAPNRMFAETILLNNEPLNLIDGKEMPHIRPSISSAEKGVKLKLPSGGIGFWILPGLKVKACIGSADEFQDKNMLRKITRRFENSEAAIESNTDDKNNRVTTDDNSVEDRKPTLRMQRTVQKRLTLRRNIRHKEDEKDDLNEKKLRKLDRARRDFDRLEKIMRRKDQYSVNLKSGGTHGVFESSDEQDSSSQKGISMRKNGEKDNSGEAIRAKLQEYRKRLSDYESKIKQRELINLPKEHLKEKQEDSLNKGLDTEKVIEALTLITKVESAMKSLEKENNSEVEITSVTPTLKTNDYNDVTAGLHRTNNASQRNDNILLDEVLNTEKSKRTSIPTKIEDQLKALYHLLSEDEEKRDQTFQRRRRDLYKHFNIDPLRLQCEKKIIDYDYKDDNINKKSYQTRLGRNWKRLNSLRNINENEDTWLEDSEEINPMPKEFSVNVKLQSLKAKENLKAYRELWEAKSYQKDKTNKLQNTNSVESMNHRIVAGLYNYNDLTQNQQNIQSHTIPSIIISNIQQESTIKNNDEVKKSEKRLINANMSIINPSEIIQNEKSLFHRTKRYSNNLEDLLQQEMITQDDNNLKDCQCRVIRGIEECKDCDLNLKSSVETTLIHIPNKTTENSILNNFNTKNRFRRDLNEKSNNDCETSVVDKLMQNKNIDKVKHQLTYNVNKELNLMQCNKSKENIVPEIINLKNSFKIINDNSEIQNRLPKKTEQLGKLLHKTRETLNTPTIKINLQNNENNSSTINDYVTINANTTSVDETESLIEHTANIRSVDSQPFQRAIPLEKTVDTTFISNSTRYINEKKLISNSKNDEKNTNDERGNINTKDQTTTIAITSNVTEIEQVSDTNSKNISSINTNATNINSKAKQKNSSALKIARQSRLTTRAEALAALKKENESRRAKKMIEASIKVIELEKSKLTEYQKKRHDQIERLKRKLRAKRDKILQQYRNELLEVINENSESKKSNIHRRDLIKNFQNIDYNNIISDSNKFSNIMSNSPIKHVLEKYNCTPENYMPTFENIDPYREIYNRQILSESPIEMHISDSDTKFPRNKVEKRSTLKETFFKNKNIINKSQKEEFELKNTKSYYNANTKIENCEVVNTNDFKKDKNEYYSDVEKQQLHEPNKYTKFMHNQNINKSLYSQYSPKPIYTKDLYKKMYNTYPTYIPRAITEYLNKMIPINIYKLKKLNSGTDESNVPKTIDINTYYKMNNKLTPIKQIFEKNIKLTDIANYKNFNKKPLEQNDKKSERSNLEVFEIEPSLYVDENYTSGELIMRPTHQFPSKIYHQYPDKYINRRYKKSILSNEEKSYKPLSFSLGLEKSKMLSKKSENNALPNNLNRRKRVVNGFSEENKVSIKKKALIHKNIKKVYETHFNKISKKFIRIPKYIKLSKQNIEIPLHSNKIIQISNSSNDILVVVKKFPSKYLNKFDSKGISRQKRFIGNSNNNKIIESGKTGHLKNLKMDGIGNNITENEKLFQQYDQKNSSLIFNIIKTRNDINHYLKPINKSLSNKKNLTIQDNSASILIDTIPKFESVISGRLKKAVNDSTDSLENFIDNFNKTTNAKKTLKDNSKGTNSPDLTNEKLTENIFKIMVGSVKKFFGLVLGIAKIFHRQ